MFSLRIHNIVSSQVCSLPCHFLGLLDNVDFTYQCIIIILTISFLTMVTYLHVSIFTYRMHNVLRANPFSLTH